MAEAERGEKPVQQIEPASGQANAAGPASPADDGEATLAAAGVIQLAQTNTVDVPLPGTLERVVVQTQSDTVYDLPDGTEGLQAHQGNGDLTLAFPNGGLVEFSGFADTHGVRFHTHDKGTQNADGFLKELHHHDDTGPLPPDNPLFTPGPPPEILGALAPIGPLPPTELHFGQALDLFHNPLADNNLLLAEDANNQPPVAPSGDLRVRADGNDPAADPILSATTHFAWSQIVDNGQGLPLPSDPDGDPITIKVVSLPPEFTNNGSQDTRFDLYVDNGGTKQALHPGDVLSLDQLQNKLFYWEAQNQSGPAQLGTMVYSVTDSHMHTVQGIISFHIVGE